MGQFSYSLLLSLLHSTWQAGLLVCIYYCTGLLNRRSNPIYKRNLLFILLGAQLLLSLSTFLIYYTGSDLFNSNYISTGLSALSIDQTYIEKLAPWLVMIYSIALIFKISRLLLHWKEFRIKGRAAWIKPSIDTRLFTSMKAAEFGIRRKVSLWYSDHISTPLTFGYFKPVILLPVALVNNLTLLETEALIIHEITHIKSNDYFLNWLLIGCETLFFFNPFIRHIASRIRLEREKNCDSSVLQFNYSPVHYAETLLKAARFRSSAGTFYLAAAFRNTHLVKRIQFFTEAKNLQFRKRNYSLAAVIPLLLILVSNIFLLNYIRNRNNEPAQDIAVAVTPAFPVNYYENVPDEFSTTAVVPEKTGNKNPLEKTVEPFIEKALSDRLENITDAASPAETILENNLAVPVTLEEKIPGKEITLTNESSATGKSITNVYHMQFENGEWKVRLMWSITAQRPISDSLNHLKDSVLNATRVFNYDNAQ